MALTAFHTYTVNKRSKVCKAIRNQKSTNQNKLKFVVPYLFQNIFLLGLVFIFFLFSLKNGCTNDSITSIFWSLINFRRDYFFQACVCCLHATETRGFEICYFLNVNIRCPFLLGIIVMLVLNTWQTKVVCSSSYKFGNY